MTSAQVLARFAAELKFDDIPAAVVTRAKDCIIDTIAAMTFGARLPWSRMVADYARRYGAGGPCSLIGSPDLRVHAPYAALAHGVFAHAFEQDGGRDPSAGVHPGATLLPAVLAACEETRADGRSAITAFVAACEVMFRIGAATRYAPERLGFHQPGLTGPYGAAVAAGRVLGLDAAQLAHALGIAGSLSAGLLAFTKSAQGGMVKRLHLGRACESGVLAARLAGAGYAGPETVLEGKFGFLDGYCRGEGDPALLTAGLGKDWETSRISMKRYPCHMNAHSPIQALKNLIDTHGFPGADIENIMVEGSEVLVSHHNIVEPHDIGRAQYSVPFCIGLALFRDPEDPRSWDASALKDPAIHAASRKVTLRALDRVAHSGKYTRLTVTLKDGRKLTGECEVFKGLPRDPFSRVELRNKFMLLAGEDQAAAARLFERLERLEAQPKFSLL